jgi:hypothetical protein
VDTVQSTLQTESFMLHIDHITAAYFASVSDWLPCRTLPVRNQLLGFLIVVNLVTRSIRLLEIPFVECCQCFGVQLTSPTTSTETGLHDVSSAPMSNKAVVGGQESSHPFLDAPTCLWRGVGIPFCVSEHRCLSECHSMKTTCSNLTFPLYFDCGSSVRR